MVGSNSIHLLFVIPVRQCYNTKRGIEDACAQGHVRTQLKGRHLQTKERSLRRTKPANTVIFNFWATNL